jgi:hypothetical protein
LLAWCALLVASRAGLAAEISVLDGLVREFTVDAGQKIEAKLLIRNNAPTPQEVGVYQTDYLFSADGRNAYGDPGAAPRSNARWLTLTPREFVIPAGETYPVFYALQVPPDPKLVGTYWSMVMVEPVTQSLDVARTEDGKPVVSVRTVIRYGVQFVTNIGDTGKREIKFLDKQLIAKEGKVMLRLDIENTGERGLRPAVWAELYNQDGASVGRFGSEQLRIYPGCSARFDIDISRVPKGEYSALIVADNLDDNVFGAQCKLQIQ